MSTHSAGRLPEEALPASAGARFPSLARAADGRIAMVWLGRARDSVPMVQMAVRDATGRWSAASTVVRDSAIFVNFADVPRVAWISRSELAVTWLQRNGAGRYDYGVRTARSRDGDANWQLTAAAHDTSERGEHGFVSLLSNANNGVALSFLNGSNVGAPGGATQLAFAELDRNGQLSLSTIVDGRVCDCCQTALAQTSSGPVIVFRDRTNEEIRDISITRYVDGSWTRPVPVHADRWKISGCPVNGPAISANHQQVAVAWFTGARDTAKVQVAFSTDGGSTFSAPVRVDEGNPAGHVDVVRTNGGAYVSWLERGNDAQLTVRVRRIDASGKRSQPVTLANVNGIRPSGFPAMVAHDNGVFVAWTVPGKPTRLQAQTISREAFK